MFLSAGQNAVTLDLHPDLRVLSFTAAVAALTGLLVGLAPALRSRHLDLLPALRGAETTASAPGLLRPGKILAVLQVALSVVLLIGAGLFVRGFQNLNGRESRASRESVLIIRVGGRLVGLSEMTEIHRLDNIYQDLLRTVEQVPGVRSVSSIVNWFTWPSRFWAVGPTMLETIFDGGRRRATSEDARANYDATVANYRQITLVAFQEVEDNLAALRILEHEAAQQKEAVAEAARGVEIFTNRYQLGADPYLQVVSAETIELQNQRNDVDILRRRMDASVLLIKALGGGWDVAQLPQVSSMR
ncbi:MAG TPA: TolC family protein [Bryobacteraceae bacterium]|nr:TolC family protein [Bryobacteraceae bacterium]